MNGLSYSALMPPMCLLLIIPAGAVIAFWWRRTGLTVVLAASILLYALCTPFVSTRLLIAVESRAPPSRPAALARGQAIAVLSGHVYEGRQTAQSGGVGPLTLERLNSAALLYDAHPLPVIVTGAADRHGKEPAAVLMARALDQDFSIKATWIEPHARNTFENGARCAEILEAHGIRSVIVVTQAWHMPRALWSFAHAGLYAVPAPVHRTVERNLLLPGASSFAQSFDALHEFLGLLYYRWRYGPIRLRANRPGGLTHH